MVDYLELCESDRKGGRLQEESEVSRGLKSIAKELDVPLLALSREVETRDDKQPRLSNLRDSGLIEKEPDVVMFVFREEYYLAQGGPAEGPNLGEAVDKAKVNIAKNHHGPTGTATLRFDRPMSLGMKPEALRAAGLGPFMRYSAKYDV